MKTHWRGVVFYLAAIATIALSIYLAARLPPS